MINLLPPIQQKIIKLELLRRLIVVISTGVFFLLLAQISLSLGLLFFLDLSAQNYKSQLTSVQRLAELKDIGNSEAKIKEINERLDLFTDNQNKIQPVAAAFSKIIETKPTAVEINSLFFDSAKNKDTLSKISLRGYAATREDLMSFADTLRTKNYFSDVKSPISNLLSGKNIDFSIIIDLKQP